MTRRRGGCVRAPRARPRRRRGGWVCVPRAGPRPPPGAHIARPCAVLSSACVCRAAAARRPPHGGAAAAAAHERRFAAAGRPSAGAAARPNGGLISLSSFSRLRPPLSFPIRAPPVANPSACVGFDRPAAGRPARRERRLRPLWAGRPSSGPSASGGTCLEGRGRVAPARFGAAAPGRRSGRPLYPPRPPSTPRPRPAAGARAPAAAPARGPPQRRV